MDYVRIGVKYAIVMILRIYVVHTQECERVFSLPATQPVLKFTFERSHDGTIQLLQPENNPIFEISCLGTLCYSDQYLNCSLAPTSDIGSGNFHIKLNSFGNGQQGMYKFTIGGGTTVLKCINLHLLGTPNTPSISPNRVPHEDEKVTLTCRSTSTTDPPGHGLVMRYAWTKDGITLSSGGRFTLLPNTAAMLTISNVKQSDELSQFTCTATEEMGLPSDSSAAFQITIYYGPNNMAFNSTGDSIALREGDRFSSIACVADCKPSCTFRWTKGQTSVSTSAVLDLGVVSRDDQGEYTCTATHSVYTVFTDTKPYPITVIYGPDTVSLSPPSTIYTKSEHDPLGEIFCSAVCTPECAYTWSKDDTSETLRNNAILNLGQLSRQEAGSYICTATNPSSSATRNGSTVVVEVIYGPDAVTLNVPSVYSVSEEATVSNIECSADCWPGCVFTWTNVTGSQLISSSNVLVFGRADRYDAGDYSCLAKNSANQLSGEAEKHFTLRVQYAPEVFISMSNILWTENTPLDLRCKASGEPDIYNFTGFVQRVVDVVVPNSHIQSPGVRDSISVNIPSLQLQDTGIYDCYVHNGVPGVNKQLVQTASQRIDVQASPVIFLTESSFAGETSENITIVIPFVSIPEYTTYSVLKHDGQPIFKNEKYTLLIKKDFVNAVFYGEEVTLAGNVLEMIINDLSEEEFGVYNVQITNDINTANFSIHVMDTRKPSPPTELKLTTLNDTVIFEWTKGFNGGHEQTFVLQMSLNPDGPWVNRTNIMESESKYIKYTGRYQVNLKNLDPGIYYARLVAVNRIGAADPVTFKETVEVVELSEEATHQTSVGPVIGGTVGGIIAALVVVVLLILVIRKKYTCICLCKLAKREDVYEGTDTDNRIDTHSADDPGLNTTQTYEALSMTMDTVAYDELKIGVNGANHLDVLNASSAKPLPYYGNVQTGDTTVCNNIIPNTQVQTVL